MNMRCILNYFIYIHTTYIHIIGLYINLVQLDLIFFSFLFNFFFKTFYCMRWWSFFYNFFVFRYFMSYCCCIECIIGCKENIRNQYHKFIYIIALNYNYKKYVSCYNGYIYCTQHNNNKKIEKKKILCKTNLLL